MVKSAKPTVAVLPRPFKQIGRFLSKDSDEDEEQDDYEEIGKFSYGLIVGQFPKSEDPLAYIVYFARTPVEVKDDEEESEVVVETLEKVDPDWILEHAKRVSIMLPGGMQVLGVFFADEQNSEKVLKSSVVEKTVKNIDSFLNPAKKQSSYLIVHFNKSNETKACEIVTSANGSIAKNRKAVDFEETDRDFCWQSIQSKFLFDYPFVFKTGQESNLPFSQKIQEILGVVEKNVLGSKILIDNEVRSNIDEFLDRKQSAGLTSSNQSRRRNTSDGGDDGDEPDDEDENEICCLEHTAQVLLEPQYLENPEDVEILDVSSRMRVSGRMALRAYLHPKATVGEAIEALKSDLMKSLRARCDMHCDSLVAEDDPNAVDDLPVLHEPPRRVLIKLPESPVTISDLLFPGESTEASAKAVEEMFGFYPELDDLDDEQELVASPKQVVSGDGDDRSEMLEGAPTTQPQTRPSRFGISSILLSGIAVAVGVIISYFYSAQTDDDDDDDFQFAEAFIPPEGSGKNK